jgi:tryptophan synthase alpha chain
MFDKNAFIPFVTAGHPDIERSREIILALAAAGSALIEIGIPFSDPIADGPVIQRASFSALRRGYRMEDYLRLVRDVRDASDVKLIFMTYLNPVLRYGLQRLDRDAAAAGLDGLLVSDLAPEELTVFDSESAEGGDGPGAVDPEGVGRSAFQVHRPELRSVFLVAPTSSEERLERICRATTGFVYVVARTGVTGGRTRIDAAVPAMVERIRRHTDLPVAVGFGIRSKEDVRRVWEFAEGAVVGSAIVAFIEENRDAADLPERVKAYVRGELLP